MCGLPPLEGSQGIDHSAELRRLGSPGQRDAVLVQWEDTRFRFGDHPYRALRDRRYTYVLGRDEAYCLLFDRERDPYELDNLFGRPETEALRRDLDRRLVALIRDAGEELPAYVSSRVDTSAVG